MPQSAGRGLAAWPIRRKLVALVAVPIMVIVAAGAWQTTSSVTGLRQAERTRTLAQTAKATNDATVALDNELTATLVVINSSTSATRGVLADSRTATNNAISTLKTSLDQPPIGGWSGDVLLAAHSTELSSDQLTSARNGADAGTRSQLVIETSFQAVFLALRNLTSGLSRQIATSTADGTTVDQASMLAALAAAAAAAADERATGTIAMSENRLSDTQLAGLKKLAVEQDVQLQIANDHATPEQQSDIDAVRMDDTRMQKFRDSLDALNGGQRQDPTAFSAAAGQRLRNLDDLISRVALVTRDTASQGVNAALIGTIAIGGITVLVLLLIFVTLASIARTVTGPMRRLRSGAVEVATVRLPQAVRQIEQQGIDATIDLPPVMPPGTVAGPETLEVAHAVDGLTAEAVRLATAQVRLRHALDEAFVSMSRRSQTMVEKQLAIIDELESTEEDPEQLRNLFRLDHLAARMRRYNDNLLVLAGSTVRTRSNTPVPVSDVFRAATSEMEQYERVRLQPVNNAAVGGPVAGGLIHLLAELLDNAAMYSPPTSPILLTAAFTPGGGLHLEVTDSGVGIPPAELAELNARLATPGTIDTQIPSRMGLFVVGRLAHRGGFEVRLSARASSAGTVAEVLVPATHVVGAPQGGQDTPLPGRLQAPAQRTPGPLSPQGLPTSGMPSLPAAPSGFGGGPSGAAPPRPPMFPPVRPPMGLPPAPAGSPVSGLPPTSMPAPNLPRRPNLVWPGAEPKEGAGGPSTGSLPSRVPGAALSAGPLSAGPLSAGPLSAGPLSAGPGRNGNGPGVAPPEPSAFDAFGTPTEPPPIASQAPPPGAPPIGPHSATAAWSPQARAARAAGAGQPDPFSGGTDRQDDRSGLGAYGAQGRTGSDSASAPAPNGPYGAPLSFGTPPAPQTEEPGFGLNGSGLPTRTPSASFPPPTPFAPPAPFSSPAPFAPPTPLGQPAPFESPAPAADVAGTGWPSVQPPEIRQGEGRLEARSTGTPSLPSRPAGGGDPFATAKLFGVEMPDPATAAGLFTSGPKIGEPQAPSARASGPDTEAGTDAPTQRSSELPPLSFKQNANPSTGDSGSTSSNGAAPAAWDSVPPAQQTQARSTAGDPRHEPVDDGVPMIGNLDYVQSESASPIFESMSAWFADPKPTAAEPAPSTAAAAPSEVQAGSIGRSGWSPTAPTADERRDLAEDRTESLPAVSVRPGDGMNEPAPVFGKAGPQDAPRLIDLRESSPASTSGSRWASLGDQQWLAANARAASAPQVAGDTSAGLPRREPGANLLPSAASAAPSASAQSAPFHHADADAVRGRLGSYQRGVSSARQSTSRHLTSSNPAASLFTAARTAETDQGLEPDEQGGEQ